MRDVFHDELDSISDQLVEMTVLAGRAVEQATTALLDADIHLAEAVIAGDNDLDMLRQQLDAMAVTVLARQQPVATDLRIVVTALRMSSDIERMGDLARHVAQVARLRYPDCAVPTAFAEHFRDMGRVAERIVAKAGSVIASKDVEAAVTLESDDDAMDELHRRLFTLIVGGGLPTETAVDLTLLGRYYERFADHAVSVARRVVYLVTGVYHSDASVDHEEQEEVVAADALRSTLPTAKES
ncbi:MAG: phosphate signaling complex protein PhoU [Dermatophilaceae bacterium]